MNELIKEALAYERENNIEQSIRCLHQALKEYPNDKDVLYYAGVFSFNTGNYGEALDAFVASCNHKFQSPTKKEEILKFILAAYYEPNKEKFKRMYEDNVKTFLSYKRNYIKSFPIFEDLRYICIPKNNHEFHIFDKHTQNFEGIIDITPKRLDYYDNIAEHDCIMAVDIYDLKLLQLLHKQTTGKTNIYDSKVPIHLVWDVKKMQIYLQLVCYEPIITTKSFLFWSDCGNESEFASFFKDDQALLPNKSIGNVPEHLSALIDEAIEFRVQDYKLKQLQVSEIAASYSKEYYQELFCNPENIRILFIMRRFTPDIDHSIYADDNIIFDCINTCLELGIKYDIYTHKSDIHWIDYRGSLLSKIAEFKPHIIFEINRHKWEWKVVPDNLMQIVWVLDPVEALPDIYSGDSARKVRWNDFFLVMTKKFKDDLMKTGYPESQILHQPVPVNTSIYDKRNLSEAERERYAADIVYISNVGNPRLDAYLNIALTSLPAKFGTYEKKRIRDFLYMSYELIYAKIEKSGPVSNIEDYELILKEAAECYGVELNEAKIRDFAYEFGFRMGNSLHRIIPLVWLAECGYSLKIWGKTWTENERLKDYAMGPANHKEVTKILSCSKIAMGLQPQVTMHPRALEAMACGCLYICNNLPHDYENIRDYFVENEDFVCFYDKDDLLKKVDYYLKNEEERKRIAENGRRKTMENYSYKKAMQNWFSFIKSMLER